MHGARCIYVGSYTPEAGGTGLGITRLSFDSRGGEITAADAPVASVAPSYLTFSADGRVLYACHEVEQGALSVLVVAPDGTLTQVDTRATVGSSPCHIAVSASGDEVFVANFGGGVAAFPAAANGMITGCARLLGLGSNSQDTHPHMVWPRPGSSEVLIPDMGFDRVIRLRAGRLAAVAQLPSGSGPRHLAVHRDGRIFVLNELNSSLLTLVTGGRSAAMRLVATTAATGLERVGNFPSEIALSADGRRLYAANRGRDTIAVFDVECAAPILIAEVPCGGQWPRHFELIDGCLVVANERSEGVAVLRIDPSGVPRYPHQVVNVASPTCVVGRPSPAEC